MRTIMFKGFKCYIEFAQYSNGRTAIQLLDTTDHGPVAKATVNIPNVPQNDGEVFIKDWAENETMLAVLESAGIVEDTGRIIPTGYAFANVCRLLV